MRVTIRQDDTSTFTWSKTHLLKYLSSIMKRDASCLIQFRDGTAILVADDACTCSPVFVDERVLFAGIDDCPIHGMEE